MPVGSESIVDTGKFVRCLDSRFLILVIGFAFQVFYVVLLL